MAVATYGAGLYGTDIYGELVSPTIHVRDKPPLRITTEACTPSGRRYRWASDEPDPANVPSGQRHSDTMPGGFEQYGATLPRKPGIDYADLERLTTITVRGAGGKVVGEYRLDSAPRTSGDQMAVSPAAVGYQAALEDNKFARMVYRDIDLGHWGASSSQDKLDHPTFAMVDPAVQSDEAGGPEIAQLVSGLENSAPYVPAVYSGNGTDLGAVRYANRVNQGNFAGDANYAVNVALSSGDTSGTFLDQTGDIAASTPAAGTLSAGGTGRKFAWAYWSYSVAGDWTATYGLLWKLIVYGNHGLTLRGTEPDAGFYASDVVTHAVQTWAPQLTTEIQQSSFIIPHLAFLEPTTAGEIVRQASRFDLPDWAVWENRTFWWTERGGQARRWRARIGPSELEETGPQMDRLWESIVVQYNDVDGSTRTVGPPGSGADTESADLKDYDPDNPANKTGLTRRDLLAMGTSTAAGATEVGRRFLLESRLLDRSGKARAVGYVEDDRGVLHPYWAPRAGDEIAFVDASDKSYRRIVRTDKDHDSRTVSFDLDAPPEGLQQLLERLGVVLVPLGLGS